MSAEDRARENLNRALREAIEPTHCPRCGIYQPKMVGVLREQHGKRYDPNKYASERIAIPAASAWRAVCAANTVAAYRRFMEVWPVYDWHAKKQIKQLRYPPHVRKLVSGFFSIVGGALFLLAISIFVLGALGYLRY